MIKHTVSLTVPNARAEQFYDFMINPTDERYSEWWQSEHLQFNIIKHGDENHLGDLVFMDEWLTNSSGKRHRLKFSAVVIAADCPNKITWQMKKRIRLPAFVTLSLQDSPEGIALTHELQIGFGGIGKILDPFIRLYFNKSMKAALTTHCNAEWFMLAEYLDENSYDVIALPEFFPLTTSINEKSLHEITEVSIISRITQTFPSAVQAIAKTVSNNAMKSVELFKLDIPSTALTKSKEVEGAFRAFSRGKDTISKNANLTKVNPVQLNKATALANSAANIMNVGSLIVGQYYMSEINTKLETMSKTINKINDFQNREFKSRIVSLIPLIGEVSEFSVEIMENNETRSIKLSALEDLKAKATELLSQVNITISELIKSNTTPDYKEYQNIVDEFNILVEHQNILITALEKISELTYLLGKGSQISDMCYSVFNKFLEQSLQTRTSLEQWHRNQVKSLSIDLDKKRISKSGVEGFFAAIPAIIIDDLKYKQMEDGLIQKITTQSKSTAITPTGIADVYDKDVEIIVKDGKYYLLTETD